MDGCPIFHGDRDRLYFFACLAEACDHFGVLCHAAVLMPNHVHLVVEDTPGLLSLFMHRLLGHYALVFNLTRPRRRRGPLFQGPFDAQVLDTETYFRAACGYAFLNPLRCKRPLAPAPDDYVWSTAAFTLAADPLSAAAFCEQWLERFGGLEAVLASLPAPRRAASRAMLERRFACLRSGAWLDRTRLLAGRSPEEYRNALRRQAGCARPTSENAGELAIELDGTPPGAEDGQSLGAEASGAARVLEGEPPCARSRRRDPFDRLESWEVVRAIREVCSRVLACEPAALESSADHLAAYLTWRFGGQDERTLAALLSMSDAVFAEARDAFRRLRVGVRGWSDVLWRAEWALRWRLLAAPWRA